MRFEGPDLSQIVADDWLYVQRSRYPYNHCQVRIALSYASREDAMVAITALLNEDTVFGPDDITAMSVALEDVCEALKLNGNAKVKEMVAIRIIELVRQGERSPTRLRDRLLRDIEYSPAATAPAFGF